jgi:hypothetical protein
MTVVTVADGMWSLDDGSRLRSARRSVLLQQQEPISMREVDHERIDGNY